MSSSAPFTRSSPRLRSDSAFCWAKFMRTLLGLGLLLVLGLPSILSRELLHLLPDLDHVRMPVGEALRDSAPPCSSSSIL